jgi:hypothetical protein
MKKDRLEWVMSGLNQHALTKTEDQFLKTVMEDFETKNALTEPQELRLETLYKEKSKLIPNKTSSKVSSLKESSPRKSRPRKPRAKMVF